MNLIRRVSLSVLVLIACFGVAAYFSTCNLQSGYVGSTAMFIISWTICAFAAVISASVILLALHEGRGPELGATLMKCFLIGLAVATFAGIVINAVANTHDGPVVGVAGSSRGTLDDVTFCVVFLSAVGGWMLSFFGMALVHVRESWLSHLGDDPWS